MEFQLYLDSLDEPANVAQQHDAYRAGVQDGQLSNVMPGASAIQRRQQCDGAPLVCYLNGVLDGIANGQ